MDMKESSIKVYETKDYSAFKKKDGNRALNENHVREVMDSIRKHGYIANPVRVDDDMAVLEGQHSIEALKRLGMSVPYIVVHNAPEDACRILNDTSRPWEGQERLDNAAANGDERAKMLLRQRDMHPDLRPGIVYEAYTKTYSNHKKTFKIILCDSMAISELRIQILRRLKGMGITCGTGTVVAIKQMELAGANLTFLLDAVTKYGKQKIQDQSIASVSTAYFMLTDIYNFHRKTNYLVFPLYGSKEFKKMLKEARDNA